MPSVPIHAPGGYAASRAVAFAGLDGAALIVSAATPLPVTFGQSPAPALAGSTAASVIVGPFQPVSARAVLLALSGTWSGTVSLLRSTDGGGTKLSLTVAGAAWGQFSGNCCEPVWEESESAVELYLDIALTAGTVTYRLAQ